VFTFDAVQDIEQAHSMSFARARVLLGLSSRRFLTLHSRSLNSSAATRRLLSTTSTISYASPTNHVHSSGHQTVAATDESGKDFNPYKDGPGAIDKAVHIFFFTEILRGAILHLLLELAL
jgi:NADH dehydrogenase (ubiquinone) Fe-S protein 8